MGFLKSKDEKELDKLEKINEKMEQYGLENLSDEDKKRARLMMMGLAGTSLISLGSSGVDSAKIDLLKTIVDQNFMIIKLLNDINNK